MDSQPDTQIRAIFFDFGNVIAKFDHMKTCEALSNASHSRLSPEEIYNRIFKSELEARYDKGEISSIDFYHAVLARTGIRDVSFLAFAELWGNIFSENRDIENVLLKIELPIERLFVLSNTNELHWRYIEKLPLMQWYFSDPWRLVRSYEIGAKKPDARIFTEALRRSRVKHEEAVFIDDIPEYVETFKKLGGNGIVYDCRRDSWCSLIRALDQFGVIRSW